MNVSRAATISLACVHGPMSGGRIRFRGPTPRKRRNESLRAVATNPHRAMVFWQACNFNGGGINMDPIIKLAWALLYKCIRREQHCWPDTHSTFISPSVLIC